MTTHTRSYMYNAINLYSVTPIKPMLWLTPKKNKKMSTERIITVLQYNVIYSTLTINKVVLCLKAHFSSVLFVLDDNLLPVFIGWLKLIVDLLRGL